MAELAGSPEVGASSSGLRLKLMAPPPSERHRLDHFTVSRRTKPKDRMGFVGMQCICRTQRPGLGRILCCHHFEILNNL